MFDATAEVDVLLEEVKEQASFRNGEVVQAAFDLCGITCAHCDYPRHAADFDSLLFHYIDACRGLHRARKRLEYAAENFDGACEFYTQRLQAFNEADSRKWRAAETIRSVRPCLNCRRRYNPTRRVKLGYQKWPEKKDYLNVE